ncbi:MAG: hypothetical protein ACI9N1_000738 [Flavobacteriales bacterium]|jgi:hypothetical protein
MKYVYILWSLLLLLSCSTSREIGVWNFVEADEVNPITIGSTSVDNIIFKKK